MWTNSCVFRRRRRDVGEGGANAEPGGNKCSRCSQHQPLPREPPWSVSTEPRTVTSLIPLLLILITSEYRTINYCT